MAPDPVHRWTRPPAVSGFVLAGGRSSRMGRDKALLELAGKPLVEHAVTKLRRICRDVAILSNNDELSRFAPVVNDLHANCGPMSGIEAALAHASEEWSLILPVDLPFPPTAFLRGWMERTLERAQRDGTRIALFTVDGRPQPTLLMIHREVAAYVTVALAQGRYQLFSLLEAAAGDFASGSAMVQFSWTAESRFSAGERFPRGPAWSESTPAQEAATGIYFMNLNTPEEFAEAERHADVVDT